MRVFDVRRTCHADKNSNTSGRKHPDLYFFTKAGEQFTGLAGNSGGHFEMRSDKGLRAGPILLDSQLWY